MIRIMLAGIILDNIDAVLTIGVPILATIMVAILRAIWKDNAAAKEAIFRAGVGIAYDVVNNIALTTQNTVDDKVAKGLQILRDYLATKGQELTPAKAAEAQIIFDALHGQQAKQVEMMKEAKVVAPMVPPRP